MAKLTPRRLKLTDQKFQQCLRKFAKRSPLWMETFAFMDGRVDPPSPMHYLTEALARDQAESGEIWVLGSPPNACVFLTLRSARLYLGKLALKSEHRQRGLPKPLVDPAVQRARQLKLPAVALETRMELVESHAAFKSIGFQSTARRTAPDQNALRAACRLRLLSQLLGLPPVSRLQHSIRSLFRWHGRPLHMSERGLEAVLC